MSTPRPNPRLQFYLRVDGQGRVVPGTGVWRLKPPKTGRWQLIPQTVADQCCGFTTTAD